MNKTKIIIVNENDKIIGYKNINTLNQSDIYRVSALWIKNSKGDILLAQRSFSKKHDPGKWGPAVAGTVDKGETYDINIIKESEEEIGLKNFEFKKVKKVRIREKYNYFGQWYVAILDKNINEFKIQKKEVENLKWFSAKELVKELNSNPDKFLKSIKDCIDWFK